MASLLAAQLPLNSALSVTLEQAEKRHVASVRDDVRAGHKLSTALALRPRDFPEIYRALISAGKESGDLSQVMDRLADYIEERNALRSEVLTAFIYPVVVAAMSVLIVIFLLGYVVPQIVTAFRPSRLPMLTRVMLALSDYARDWLAHRPGLCHRPVALQPARTGCARPGTAASCACRWRAASCWA